MRRLSCLAALLITGCVVVQPNTPQVPGAPTVSAIAGDGTAEVDWNVPFEGSSPIVDYIITISPGGWQVAAASNSISVQGLVNGVPYTFAVQAENSVGIGPAGVSPAVTPSGPPGEPQVGLGPQNAAGYHVKPNAATSLPAGGVGYLITANGQGGYRLFWADTLASGATFSGTITTDGTFDPQQTVQTGSFTLTPTAANQYSFSAVPIADVQGIDVNASTDPVYIEAQINGSDSGVAIYFTGATSNLVEASQVNPVAFTSP